MLKLSSSAIKYWFTEVRFPGKTNDDIAQILSGFSVGLWLGAKHPEIMDKVEKEMPDEVGEMVDADAADLYTILTERWDDNVQD